MNTSTPNLDIEYVANLARLALSDDEKEVFSRQLKDILGYISQLQEVDVSGVEPMAHAFPLTNVWREDIPQPGLSREDALRNAPSLRDHMLVVPKVVEG